MRDVWQIREDITATNAQQFKRYTGATPVDGNQDVEESKATPYVQQVRVLVKNAVKALGFKDTDMSPERFAAQEKVVNWMINVLLPMKSNRGSQVSARAVKTGQAALRKYKQGVDRMSHFDSDAEDLNQD